MASTSASAQPRPLVPRTVGIRLVGGGLALAAVLVLIGWAITKWLAGSGLEAWEDGVNRWFVTLRTPTLNTWSLVASDLSQTFTCIGVTIVVGLLLRRWLGRWRETWAVVVAITGELLVFLVVTAAVNRQRPDVPHLDVAPPTSSFPSGHCAAAVALYGCIAIVLWRNLSDRRLARLAVAVGILVPLLVATSRLYRGMHHPTDVLFGLLGGAVWLAIAVTTVLPRQVGGEPEEVGPAPLHEREFDLRTGNVRTIDGQER